MVQRLFGPIVINLDSRPDRWREIISELTKVNLSPTRLSATPGGAIGCLDSHCKALELFLKTGNAADAVLIVEDDAQFNCDSQTLQNHIREFQEDTSAHVACLGYNARIAIPHSPRFHRSREIQTRVCYIVKRSIAIELLILWRQIQTAVANKTTLKWYENLFRSLPISNPPKDIYRGDQSWKILQQEYVFVIPTQRLVIQRPSYSDIEKQHVNYRV